MEAMKTYCLDRKAVSVYEDDPAFMDTETGLKEKGFMTDGSIREISGTSMMRVICTSLEGQKRLLIGEVKSSVPWKSKKKCLLILRLQHVQHSQRNMMFYKKQ